ncbi:MAG: hypothetical protein R3F17_13240 [Planctomycetota bacterium]
MFTILPFEPHWYARHRVAVTPVGHPLLDELAHLPPPPAPRDAARTRCVLLPGSRGSEIEDNLAWMLDALRAARQPFMRFVIAQSSRAATPNASRRSSLGHPAGARVALEIGDRTAPCATCASPWRFRARCSPTCSHRIPAVVIYRDPGGWKGKLKDRLLTTGLFASTNLVAGRAVLPEYCRARGSPRSRWARTCGSGAGRDRRDRVLADLDEVAHCPEVPGPVAARPAPCCSTDPGSQGEARRGGPRRGKYPPCLNALGAAP